MGTRHKVFVSYHHANDQARKQIFDLRFGNKYGVVVPGSVDLGEIDPNLSTERIRQKIRDEYLRDTSVTVVLVGTETWKRKHVDWEIASSLRHTEYNPRSGLVGIILPSYEQEHGRSLRFDRWGRITGYDPYTIPPRLHDNVECGFAELHRWTEDPEHIETLVHQAYLRKSRVLPDNRRPMFGNNRPGQRWSP